MIFATGGANLYETCRKGARVRTAVPAAILIQPHHATASPAPVDGSIE
ncbi:MAG: hypothetical protein GX216_09080 [Methanomicrobiales archaeon]|nr:hypothetical protein [Methanomicrobiales archaeon]